MHKPELAALISRSFVIIHIDTGHGDKNIDVAQTYGVPISHGIPALAVLDGRGKLLYAQDQGQFADARHMSYSSIRAFFEQWKPKPGARTAKKAALSRFDFTLRGLLQD